jgi:hypothetical protein
VVGGQIAGTWKRTLRKDGVVIKAEDQAVGLAARRYGEFLERPAVIC